MRPIDGDAVREETARASLTTRFIDAAPTVDPWEATRRDALGDPPPEEQDVLVHIATRWCGLIYAVGYRIKETYWVSQEQFSYHAQDITGWWPLPGNGKEA